MAKKNQQLEWCVIRLGEDFNWWVEEISDDVHWDLDALGIVDPRQFGHIMELCEPLRDYGFDPEIIDRAFFAFAIEKELKERRVRLVRVKESFLEGEDSTLFALPDILDEKGPYADFLDQITKARVMMLNDLIEFEQLLTIDEVEEAIRERQNADFFEGRAVHFFAEITSILEYVPDGYELDEEDARTKTKTEDEEIADLPEFEVTEDETLEEDETMKWDDEEETEEEEDEEEQAEGDDEDEEEEDAFEDKPRRRRRDDEF
ncbi:MAG: hypothetical protein SFY80_09855 [Verrucomicrobiota bacterium]|nr:hypothetical protein [Verrucomicrobiota bacterium]